MITALEAAQMRERTEAARRRKQLISKSVEEAQAWIELQAREKPTRMRDYEQSNQHTG